jgi:hypothetical protein
VPADDWIGYLEGKNADYPEKALRADLAHVRSVVTHMDTDDTTADTRLADYMMTFNRPPRMRCPNSRLARISRAISGRCTPAFVTSIPRGNVPAAR